MKKITSAICIVMTASQLSASTKISIKPAVIAATQPKPQKAPPAKKLSFLDKLKGVAKKAGSALQSGQKKLEKAAPIIKTVATVGAGLTSKVGDLGKGVSQESTAGKLLAKLQSGLGKASTIAGKIDSNMGTINGIAKSAVKGINQVTGSEPAAPEPEPVAPEPEPSIPEQDVEIVIPDQQPMAPDADAQVVQTVMVTQEPEITVAPDTVAKIDPIFVVPGAFIGASNKGLTDADMPYFVQKLIDRHIETGQKLSVDLAGNAITQVGLRQLLETLKTHVKLLGMLSMSENNIEDGGALVLAEYIPHMVATTTLCFRNTRMSESAIHAVVEAVAENDVILHMDFSGNLVSQAGLMKICEVVGRLKAGSLRNGLFLKGNQINTAGINLPDNVRV